MLPPVDLDDEVIAALRRITRAIDLHSRALVQQHGLTAPQLAALRAIERLQPVSATAVARSIHVSQATLTGILSRLERRQLIRRGRSGHDRRSVLLELDESAEGLLAAAPSQLQERFRRRLAGLQDWEQAMMLAVLQRLAAMMDAEEPADMAHSVETTEEHKRRTYRSHLDAPHETHTSETHAKMPAEAASQTNG